MKFDIVSGLVLPERFIEEKHSLKKSIDSVIDQAVYDNQRIRGTYFLTIHAKFDRFQPDTFTISPPVTTKRLPPFISNQMVFWVSNEREICELLWMVPPKKRGEKLKVEFNKSGVAYLQAKGAMPS